MRAFFAALYKDIKLFLSGAGILALLLPILLLPALSLGMDDLSSAQFMESFPIAVRDEDDTVMSRTLIMQLREIELFSEVRVLEEGVTDQEALSDGAAAVATIPRDFFYDLYDMADCPVAVTLSAERSLDSAVFRAVFTSVMGIIRANHASALGVYRFAYGELTDEVLREMRKSSGDRLALDALGRQGVFAAETAAPDLAGALTRRLAACVLGVLALFFAMGSAKTGPEERRLGVIPRLRALGLGSFGFTASKLLTALLLSLPAAAVCALLGGAGMAFTLALYALLLFGGFGLMSLIAALAGSSQDAQRWGNILILLSLALGGTLWPQSALPGVLRPIKYLALPWYASLALECRNAGVGGWTLARYLWPLAAMGVLGLAGAHFIRRIPRRAREKKSAPSDREPSGKAARGFFGRLSMLTLTRLRSLSGGFAALAATLAAALLCGLVSQGLLGGGARTLRLCVLDRDKSDLSRELIERLGSSDGVELAEVSAEEGRLALLTGQREGLLVIGEGYGGALQDGGQIPLRFEAAPSAVTAQGAREIVAGAAMSQLRRVQSVPDAEKLLGRPLTGEETAELYRLIDDYAQALPPLYDIEYSSGRAKADPFAPSPMGFACLVCLFTLLTAASALSGRDAGAIRRRMASLKNGRALYELTELLALTLLGAVTELFVLIPGIPWALRGLPAVLASSLCFASLAILLTRLGSREGRLDALAPVLALLLCLLGGCFMDLSALPEKVAALTLLSPAAIALRAYSGSLLTTLALLLESALFATAAAFAGRRK